jgi:hypothetical protein
VNPSPPTAGHPGPRQGDQGRTPAAGSTKTKTRATRAADELPLRLACCTSLLYGDAIHKLGMADDGAGMLVTCNRLEERRSSDFYGLRLKPELLTVLRHAGIDLLAYDGALCSEIASPLAEAVLRIEGDPGLRALFRSVVGCYDGVASEVTGNLRRVALKCAQRPAVTLRVRTMDDHPFGTKRH